MLLSSCTLVDSVDGYAGRPETTDAGDAGSVDAAPDALSIDSGKGCQDETDCDDDNVCTGDSCFGGTCVLTTKPGASCSDGNPCNGAEVCDADGSCRAGTPPPLDDDDDCTVDYCDPAKGVVHELGDYPPSKSCNPYICPSNYFRAKALLCDPYCGTDNCGFCVNGFQCERACTKTVTACCVVAGDCPKSCPTGYSMIGETCSADCGCLSCGPAAICQR